MARAMKWICARSGCTLALAKSAQMSPGAAGGVVALDAEQEPGFLRHLAHGGERAAAREILARVGHALEQLLLHVGMQFARRRHDAVERLDAPAREDELARHEFVAGVAAAEQHFRLCAGAVDQHQRRRVARLAVGERLVALHFGHAFGPDFGQIFGRRVLRHRAFRCLPRGRYVLALFVPRAAARLARRALPIKARNAGRRQRGRLPPA